MLRGPKLYGNGRGYMQYTDPDPGRSKEGDTFTCQHCNRVTYVPPFADPADIGGLCKSCMGLICPRCASIDRCDPLEAKIERMERGA